MIPLWGWGGLLSRWRDQEGNVAHAGGLSALAFEAVPGATSYQWWRMRHDQDDRLHFAFQLNHDWDLITPPKLHIHWRPLGDPVADHVVVWSVETAWAVPGYGSTFASSTVNATVSPGDVGKHVKTQLGELTLPSTVTASTIVLATVARLGTSVSDTYTTSASAGTLQANVMPLSVDLHYRTKRFGTVGEFA